jgi:signal transduction histidine kinase
MDQHFESPVFRTNMMEILEDTVGRMNSMVRSFHEHQRQVILKLKIQLNDILHLSIDSLLPRPIPRINVETTFAEIPSIWGDSFLLQEAFMSLIQNALDAMPDGGTLRVQTRRADTRKSPRVAVEIADTGIGMSESSLETELFQPFSTTKESGLGLGLYTTRQIVALHSGRITVKSSPGAGTTVTIVFPVDANVS